MDRGSLLIDHQGATMALQQIWSVYLSPTTFHPDQDIHILGDGIGSGSDIDNVPTKSPSDATGSMERYLTYSYLKRLGFVVTRPGTYDTAHDSPNAKVKNSKDSTLAADKPVATTTANIITLPQDTQTKTKLKQSQEQGVISLKSPLWTMLIETWDQLTFGINRWWHIKRFIWSGETNRPIVSQLDRIPIGKKESELERSSRRDPCLYEGSTVDFLKIALGQILPKLQIVPDLRLASKVDVSSSKSIRRTIDFFVYKPAGAFKKRQPGNPDYRVIVIRLDYFQSDKSRFGDVGNKVDNVLLIFFCGGE